VPTRKQRRRQQKERRHEYEVVYLDEEGNEVEVEPEEEPARGKKPGQRGTAARQSGRPGRKIDPPSWQRVFRRTLIFAPVMLLVIYFIKPKDQSNSWVVIQFAILLLLFLPFSYYMDSIMYRQYRKRIGDPLPPRERKPRSGS
jgi:hypothetical protein